MPGLHRCLATSPLSPPAQPMDRHSFLHLSHHHLHLLRMEREAEPLWGCWGRVGLQCLSPCPAHEQLLRIHGEEPAAPCLLRISLQKDKNPLREEMWSSPTCSPAPSQRPVFRGSVALLVPVLLLKYILIFLKNKTNKPQTH